MSEPFNEWDEVKVTGRIVSEKNKPCVTELHGVIGDCSTLSDFIKVWPLDYNDPQLPNDHDGKLWFDLRDSATKVSVVRAASSAE